VVLFTSLISGITGGLLLATRTQTQSACDVFQSVALKPRYNLWVLAVFSTTVPLSSTSALPCQVFHVFQSRLGFWVFSPDFQYYLAAFHRSFITISITAVVSMACKKQLTQYFFYIINKMLVFVLFQALWTWPVPQLADKIPD